MYFQVNGSKLKPQANAKVNQSRLIRKVTYPSEILISHSLYLLHNTMELNPIPKNCNAVSTVK